jgi:hypothetical protein
VGTDLGRATEPVRVLTSLLDKRENSRTDANSSSDDNQLGRIAVWVTAPPVEFCST